MEEKYLPLEVSDEDLDLYVHELMAMMPEEKLFTGGNVKVIPEAQAYIGKDRAVAIEKIGLISEMTGLVGNFRRNWVDQEAMKRDADPKRKELDNIMDRILAMVNPEEREKARALISRIWKYFEENEKKRGKGLGQNRIKSYDLTASLEEEFKAKEIHPLTMNEKMYLLDTLASLKKGSTEMCYVNSRLESSMKSALGHAYPHSRRSREIARFRSENLDGYAKSYEEIKKIRDYIGGKAKEMGWK